MRWVTKKYIGSATIKKLGGNLICSYCLDPSYKAGFYCYNLYKEFEGVSFEMLRLYREEHHMKTVCVFEKFLFYFIMQHELIL